MTTNKSIRRARRVIVGGQWVLISGLVFYSLMTSTPLVAEHSEWRWSGWALGLMTDAAFIMSLTAESALARNGVTGLGGWPRAFRWTTGLATVFLNIWASVSDRDPVGVAIHLIAPVLVLLLAEVGPIYTAALAGAERSAQTPPEAQEHAVTNYFQQERAAMQEYRERSAETARQVAETIDAATARETETITAPDAGRSAVSAEEAASLVGSAEAVADALGMSLDPPKARMGNTEANKIIEEGWRYGVSATVVAEETGRHVQTVRRKYKELAAGAGA